MNFFIRMGILVCFLLSSISSPAQVIPDIKTFTIHSSILNKDRLINIYTPPGVKNGIKYPVLYVFDAESLFLPLVGAVNFMNYSSTMPQMPECYIIGITNTHRERDMPVPQLIEKNNGADQFYQFLADELLPYVKKNYQTSGLSALIGHSQGGLFVTYAGLRNPVLFPFILAMDAPVTVNPSVQKDYEQKIQKACGLRYFSAERVFGWDKAFSPENNCLVFERIKIEDETHETMPYKAMYEGLKFLFKEHVPVKKDMSLPELTAYYQNLEKKYNCSYQIPPKVILNSVKEKIGSSKKAEAIALLAYYKKVYGEQAKSEELLAKANAITKGPDERLDFFLNHAAPADKELKPFLGKWEGKVTVPGGTDVFVKFEFIPVDGKYVIRSRVNDSFNVTSDFMFISQKGELVYGRKHDGGGAYVSIGRLSADGQTIEGTEDLIGFDFPKNEPAFQINKFEFKRQP